MTLPPQSIFDGTPVATLQLWLQQAQSAYFKLITGASAIEVVTMGDVVKFKSADPDRLAALISQIQAAIAGRPQGGAIGAIFAL